MKTAVLIASLLFLSGCAFADHRWDSATSGGQLHYSYGHTYAGPRYIYARVVHVSPIYRTDYRGGRCWTEYRRGSHQSGRVSGSFRSGPNTIHFGFSSSDIHNRSRGTRVCEPIIYSRVVGAYRIKYEDCSGRIQTTTRSRHPGHSIRVFNNCR